MTMNNNILVAAGAVIIFALGWALGRRQRTVNVGTIRVIVERAAYKGRPPSGGCP